MSLKTIFHGFISINLLFFASCTTPENAQLSNVVASVNGAEITEDDLYLILQDGHNGEITPGMRTKALERLIDQELLYQHGLELGLDNDPKYRNIVTVMETRLRMLKRSEMARRVASTRIAASVEVTGKDVERYYAENKNMLSDDFRFLIMRFSEEEKAREAYRKIMNGSPFETVARGVYGDSPKGRDLPWDPGFVHWDQIPLELTQSVFSLSRGEVSGVLGTHRTGWSIVKLVDKKKNADASLDRMSPRIMNRLRDSNVRQAYDGYTAELRKKSKIIKYGERRKAS